MRVRALVVLGAMPSPELEPAHVVSGQATPAAANIFQLAASRAMGLGDGARGVTLLNLRLAPPPQAVQRQMTSSGPMVVDIHMEFCAAGARQLPHGADFERGFAISTQEFAAFHPSASRLLDLEDLSPVALHRPAAPSPQSWSTTAAPSDDGAVSWLPGDVLLWLSAALVVAGLGLAMATLQLIRRRRRLKQDKARLEAEAAVSGLYDIGTTANVGAGRLVAAVLIAFDPATEDAQVFAAAAGLGPSECLKVAPGDIMEVIASGEGWLYGRLLSAELFGYVPEECVQRVPHTPPASPQVMEAGLAASVAAAAAASA